MNAESLEHGIIYSYSLSYFSVFLGLILCLGLFFVLLTSLHMWRVTFCLFKPTYHEIHKDTWKECDSLLVLRCEAVDGTWFTVDVNVFVSLGGTVDNFAELPVKGPFPSVVERYTVVLSCVDPWGWAVGKWIVVVLWRGFVAVTREGIHITNYPKPHSINGKSNSWRHLMVFY